MANPRARNQKDYAVTLTPKSLEPRRYEALVTSNRISAADMKAALSEAASGSSELETILIDKYRVAAPDLGAALSEYYQCPYIGFNERMVVDPVLLKSLNLDYLKKNYWVPLKRELQVLDVVIDDPHDLDKGQDVRRAFPGLTLRFAVGLRRDILQFLQGAMGEQDAASYGRAESVSDILGDLVTEAQQEQQEQQAAAVVDENDSAIVRLANQIITDAYRLGASDIHIEPYALKRDTIVRLRVDGTCFEYMKIPPSYYRAIVSRIKIMANLDIAERRKAQDGKIRFSLRGRKEIELRVATVPTVGGNEDVVMRILAGGGALPLDQMGFSARNMREMLRIAQRPYGMILCVGPTGSGKTTTLHAVLGHLNQPQRKIWTAEDPVEITQVGLRQVQVMPKIDWTFATVMRAFLRADPDVIMIGEMRDKETADIAIEASLTGHLMLSTLHTNSATETIVRLLDLGCDPFNFADAMLGVLAQRLCKRLCGACKEAYQPTREESEEMVAGYGQELWAQRGLPEAADTTLYRATGCQKCNQIGFKGRLALHELLLGTDPMKRLIQSRARTEELLKQALADEMTTLAQDGIEKVLQGHTTYKQVKAVAIK